MTLCKEGYWTCAHCAQYGNLNHCKAYRPDSEEPVITVDGEKICQECADRYWRERAKAERTE